MTHKTPAELAYQREWARRKRRAQGQKPNRVGYRSPFWSRVDQSGDCWIWIGGRITKGYGRYREGYAHRHAYELTYGPIPDDLFVLHHCDNPPCVRPGHLFLGTNADNVRDMVAKGRQKHGEAHPCAKLTTTAVAEIRIAIAAGATQSELGRRYGVRRETIRQIVRGRTWRVVEEAEQLALGVA